MWVRLCELGIRNFVEGLDRGSFSVYAYPYICRRAAPSHCFDVSWCVLLQIVLCHVWWFILRRSTESRVFRKRVRFGICYKILMCVWEGDFIEIYVFSVENSSNQEASPMKHNASVISRKV